MSALPLSKKKKRITILSQLTAMLMLTLVGNDQENTAAECILDRMGYAQTLVFDVPENEWTTEIQDAWDAIDAIHNALAPEAPSSPTEQSLQALCATLGAELERC